MSLFVTMGHVPQAGNNGSIRFVPEWGFGRRDTDMLVITTLTHFTFTIRHCYLTHPLFLLPHLTNSLWVRLHHFYQSGSAHCISGFFTHSAEDDVLVSASFPETNAFGSKSFRNHMLHLLII